MIRLLILLVLPVVLVFGEIQYSGAVPTVATDTPADQDTLAAFIKDTLVTAGWSCAGSTGDWKCTTASDSNATGQIKLRMWDAGDTNCIRLAILNTSESIDLSATIPGYILPDSSTWTIIANKFHVYGVSDGHATQARHYFSAGTLYKPTFLSSLTTYGYLNCDGNSDTSTTAYTGGFRRELYANGNTQVILNSSSWGFSSSSTTSSGPPRIIMPTPALLGSTHGKAWWDGSISIVDPLLVSDDAAAGAAGDGKIVGQLWDVLATAWKDFTAGNTITYDSKTWRALTNSQTDGTLFHYVPTP